MLIFFWILSRNHLILQFAFQEQMEETENETERVASTDSEASEQEENNVSYISQKQSVYYELQVNYICNGMFLASENTCASE